MRFSVAGTNRNNSVYGAFSDYSSFSAASNTAVTDRVTVVSCLNCVIMRPILRSCKRYRFFAAGCTKRKYCAAVRCSSANYRSSFDIRQVERRHAVARAVKFAYPPKQPRVCRARYRRTVALQHPVGSSRTRICKHRADKHFMQGFDQGVVRAAHDVLDEQIKTLVVYLRVARRRTEKSGHVLRRVPRSGKF